MKSGSSWSAARVLLLLGRLALGAVFLVAAYEKFKQSWAFFALQVDSYQLLPPWAVTLVARTLPWFELALGILLVAGIGLRTVALLATLLLGGFFGVMLRTYAMHLEINCGCFGPGEKLGTITLLRDGSLLALSLAVTIGAFVARCRRRAPEAALSDSRDAGSQAAT